MKDGRVFTLKLRKGHRWSDGQPFTTEDFRYYWEDVANNKELSPAGPPKDLLVDGEAPKFEVLSETAVRYTWSKPNPHFLPRLAGASPLFIYRPGALPEAAPQEVRRRRSARRTPMARRSASGRAMHNRADNLYESDNPELPTLQPWMNTTQAAGRPLRRGAQPVLPPRRRRTGGSCPTSTASCWRSPTAS